METIYLSNALEALTKRKKEKVELHELNTRFSSYIDKVKHLELKIHVESGQSHDLSSIIESHEKEMEKLKKKVESLNKEKSLLEEEKETQFNELQSSLEQEIRLKKVESRLKEAAVKNLVDTRKELKDSNVKCKSLESQIKILEEDIKFLKAIYKKEILMLKSWKVNGSIVQTDSSHLDLTLALQGIRSQYEKMVHKYLSEIESRYKIQILDKNKEISERDEALKKARRENKDLRQEIESLNIKIKEKEETILDLTRENTNMKTESEHYIHDFKKLLDVKLVLDKELTYYKDLLDKEELRIKSTEHTHIEVLQESLSS